MLNILVPIKEKSSHYDAMMKSLSEVAGFDSNAGLIELMDVYSGESFSHKVNRGILRANSDVIIVHTDMTFTKDWLKDLTFFVEAEGPGVYGSKMLFPNGIVQHFGGAITYQAEAIHPERGLVDMGFYKHAKEVPFVTFGGVYIPKKVVDTVGYLDESIAPWGWEDVDYCLRVWKVGMRVVCTPATIIHNETVDAKKLENLDEIIAKNREYVVRKHKLETYRGVPEWK